jgi:REP element-mobilizing transposase RayT
MRFQPYTATELHFAYCYRVYLRFRTHAAQPLPALAGLTPEILQAAVEPLGVHVLEVNCDRTDCMCLLSLRPEDSVSAAVSKVKGRVSKWLRSAGGYEDGQRLLSRGYFAIAAGKSTDDAVAEYLEAQGSPHGYDGRWASRPYSWKVLPLPQTTNSVCKRHIARLSCGCTACLQPGVELVSLLRRSLAYAPGCGATTNGARACNYLDKMIVMVLRIILVSARLVTIRGIRRA